MTKNVYSVGQINKYIKNMFSQDFFLRDASVKGEISNCKYHSSGHIYFTLKDETGTISAIMFAGNRSGLGFRMKEGDKVIVSGSIEVYERDGKYQLYAKKIELDGEGNLYLKFEALKKELEEMGMFAKEYKQAIPKYVKKVGVVTAPTGAAVCDIRNVATRRNPYVQLILYPALVQGDGAVSSIIQGIHALEQMEVDVIIVGRGGGSIEDLWAFNEEEVARAIFDCRIPIISAVGHETDWTIADYVADMRAPTPSAAAELAVYDYKIALANLNEYKRRMNMVLRNKLDLAKGRHKVLLSKLQLRSPMTRVKDQRRRLMDFEDSFERRMLMVLQDKKHVLAIMSGKLDALSPTKKIASGYAYVEGIDGKSIRSVKSVKSGDELKIHVTDGYMKARIEEAKTYE